MPTTEKDRHRRIHQPSQLLTDTADSAHRALLILNQPIHSKALLQALYQTCSFRICADAGGDRLLDVLQNENDEEQRRLLPSAIHGDLDSLSAHAREFFQSRGVSVTRDPDQYSTDFGKCMKRIRERSSRIKSESPDGRGITDVVVLGSLSGRVDHGLGMLGELGREMGLSSSGSRDALEGGEKMTLTLVSPAAISFWLRPLPVENEISVPLDSQKATSVGQQESTLEFCLTPNVGILPLLKPAKLTTTGLEWDVENWETEMLGNVSTSNHVVPSQGSTDGYVKISATEPMLFTVELKMQ